MAGRSQQGHTDRDLKRLTRAELLELLLEQSKEIDRLRDELDAANRQLDERQIVIDRAGSIAEAALQLSGIFEAAQKAADDYLYNIGATADYRRTPHYEAPAYHAPSYQEPAYDEPAYDPYPADSYDSGYGYEPAEPVKRKSSSSKNSTSRSGSSKGTSSKSGLAGGLIGKKSSSSGKSAAAKSSSASRNSASEPAPRKKASRPSGMAQSEQVNSGSRKNAYNSMNTAEIPSGLGQLSTNGNGTGAIGSVADFTDSFTFGGEQYTDSYSYTNGRYSSDNYDAHQDEGGIEFFDL